MKLFLSTVALATAIALPALAEVPGDPSLENQSAYALESHSPYTFQIWQPAASARAEAPANSKTHQVYVDGQYVGADPDPLIRHQLRREERSGD